MDEEEIKRSRGNESKIQSWVRVFPKLKPFPLFCCPQRHVRPDLLSQRPWVHGLYQSGVEPSWGGCPILRSISIVICDVWAWRSPPCTLVYLVQFWWARTRATDPWTLWCSIPYLPFSIKPCLKSADDTSMVLSQDLVLTSDPAWENLEKGWIWLLARKDEIEIR